MLENLHSLSITSNATENSKHLFTTLIPKLGVISIFKLNIIIYYIPS